MDSPHRARLMCMIQSSNEGPETLDFCSPFKEEMATRLLRLMLGHSRHQNPENNPFISASSVPEIAKCSWSVNIGIGSGVNTENSAISSRTWWAYKHLYGHLMALERERFVWICQINTLPETKIAPENRPGPKRKGSSSTHPLGGGSRYFSCSPRKLGKIPNLTSIFFRWVETTNQSIFKCFSWWCSRWHAHHTGGYGASARGRRSGDHDAGRSCWCGLNMMWFKMIGPQKWIKWVEYDWIYEYIDMINLVVYWAPLVWAEAIYKI